MIKKLFVITALSFSMIFLTSCHLLLEHDYKFAYSESATCTSEGYDLYRCSCGLEEKRNIVWPLGHLYEEKSSSQTTCKEIGKIQYVCARCLDSKVVNKNEMLLPHVIVIDKGFESTCIKNGMSDGSHCSVCNSIIVQQETLPLKEHTDNDKNGYCDVCQKFLEEIKPIKDINDLKNMLLEPEASYRLDADISLTGIEWVPIFSEKDQFYGKFYGNGHTISNLTIKNNKECSLFGYNSGYISDLKVEKFTIELNNISSKIGVIANINAGTIEGCVVKDISITAEITHTDITSWPSYSGTNAKYDIMVGGVVCENFGKLNSNNLEGYFRKDFRVLNKYLLTPSQLFYIDTNYTSSCTLNLMIGGIASTSNNNIINCNNRSDDKTIFTINAQIYKKGLSIAKINCSIDGIVYDGRDKIDNCHTVILDFVKKVQATKISSNGYNGVKCLLEIAE